VIEDSHQDWEILAGLSIPTGDFGSTNMQGGKPGYATMGFSIGWGYHGELAKGFEGGFIQMFSYNSIDETEYMKLFPSGTSVDAGGWYHLWTMGGLGFAVPLETSGRFHAGGLLGFLMGFSPSITATYGSFTASQSTSAAQAISYGAYVGFRVTRVAIDLHYMVGEPEYSISATSDSYTVSGKVKQPTALFQFTIGLIFN